MKAGDRVRLVATKYRGKTGIVDRVYADGHVKLRDVPGAKGKLHIHGRYVEPVQSAQSMDFDQGFGIGGLARHVEPATYQEPNTTANPRWAGTTEHGKGKGRCEQCGQPAWWNPGAGQFLCYRHWDNY